MVATVVTVVLFAVETLVAARLGWLVARFLARRGAAAWGPRFSVARRRVPRRAGVGRQRLFPAVTGGVCWRRVRAALVHGRRRVDRWHRDLSAVIHRLCRRR